MHILTGMIITALLRKRSQGKSYGNKGLPRFRTGPIRVAHSLPGRVRFRVPSLQGDPGECERLQKALRRLDGVDSAAADPRSGTVLIRYAEGKVRAELLMAAIARLLGLEKQLDETPTPLVTRELRDIGASLNRAVLDGTRGLIDLRTAVFLLLGALGVQRLLAEKSAALPTGVTLLWWATNSLAGRHGDPAV
jgi:hypothetical protein